MESIVSNLAKPKRVTRNGRTYLVGRVISIVPGVLAGSKGALLYPHEEVAANIDAWNGMPITVYHPTKNGMNVSGRDPDVLEKQGVGAIYRTTYTSEQAQSGDDRPNYKLTHEYWIDEEDLRRVHETLLRNLGEGNPIEVSTGLYTENIPEEGVYGGKPYNYIARNYKPDHLALLPDQVGACAVRDGCGINVNTGETPKEKLRRLLVQIAKNNMTMILTTNKAAPTTVNVTPEKACEILRDKEVHEKNLTGKQKRFFGAKCSQHQREQTNRAWRQANRRQTYQQYRETNSNPDYGQQTGPARVLRGAVPGTRKTVFETTSMSRPYQVWNCGGEGGKPGPCPTGEESQEHPHVAIIRGVLQKLPTGVSKTIRGKAVRRGTKGSKHGDDARFADTSDLFRIEGEDKWYNHDEMAKRLVGNTTNQGDPMERKKRMVQWLTTNCDCWKVNGSAKVLNNLDEEQLRRLIANAETVLALQNDLGITVNAVGLPNYIREQARTLNATSLSMTGGKRVSSRRKAPNQVNRDDDEDERSEDVQEEAQESMDDTAEASDMDEDPMGDPGGAEGDSADAMKRRLMGMVNEFNEDELTSTRNIRRSLNKEIMRLTQMRNSLGGANSRAGGNGMRQNVNPRITGNRANTADVNAWLQEAPEPIREVVQNAINVDMATRQFLIEQLTANADEYTAGQLRNIYGRMKLRELKAIAAQHGISSQRGYSQDVQQMASYFEGGGANGNGYTQNAYEDDALDLPTINREEWQEQAGMVETE